MIVPPSHDTKDCESTGKRYVTFDETISMKNEKNLISKKPMKLEIVIENWKSDRVITPAEIIEPNLGVVRRLVDEYNTIEEVSTLFYHPFYKISLILVREVPKELSIVIQCSYLLVFINN